MGVGGSPVTSQNESPRDAGLHERAFIMSRSYLPRSVSFRPPTVFCIFPFTWSPLPSDSILLSPTTFPARLPWPCPCPARPSLQRDLCPFRNSSGCSQPSTSGLIAQFPEG